MTSESTDPWACLSCDALLTPGRVLFCSEVCSEFARAVRYHRRVLADGRSGQPDVQAAVSVRMANALWGEAPAKPPMAVTRAAVFAAKGDRCLSLRGTWAVPRGVAGNGRSVGMLSNGVTGVDQDAALAATSIAATTGKRGSSLRAISSSWSPTATASKQSGR